MRTSVPRLTVIDGLKYLPDGSRACSVGTCTRPALVTPKRVQSYCRAHATEATRQWREGKITTLLTPEERELILELRRVEPAGRHHARPLWKGTGYMRKTTIGAVALGVALTACGSGASAAAAPQQPARPACVTFTLGWRTPTGHEADAPMTFCGTGARQPLICNGNEGPQPGAQFTCYALPRGDH